MNIQTLIKDCQTAYQLAAAAVTHHDGGCCNFDTAVIALNCAPEEEDKIVDTLKDHQIHAFFEDWLGDRYLFITSPIPAMGDDRTRQAEAIQQFFKQQGYQSSVYYQLD